MNPYDKAHELAKALRSSEAGAALLAAKEKIEQDPATFNMVQDYRKRQWELGQRQIAGEVVSDIEKQDLAQLLETVMLNGDAKAYIEAERQLEGLLWDIQGILTKTTEDLLLEHPLASKFTGVKRGSE
ncbi:YlbF family regulator [Alicyclobacillus tolerans]|uniref:YlbF family regulator n=1 Tax=Alicyclobacillus tolerans TaxID=90970 RepID=UPI001F23D704|nr:YlbF family regulator [Alicyclobacillus tolerans]MCF8566183.1 YlbF family regulator [Alicyclobacillus tolerans]